MNHPASSFHALEISHDMIPAINHMNYINNIKLWHIHHIIPPPLEASSITHH